MSEYSEGKACADCLMLLANDETPPEMSEVETAEYLANVARHTAGSEVVVNCPEECEGGFSWSPCDVCGSRLGGDRHPVAFFEITR